MAFELPNLPYAYDALQPHMSKETFEYHHDKHHKAYVDTANKLIAGTGLEGKTPEEVVRETYNVAERKKLFNNVAQHWNHSEFWLSMKPGAPQLPSTLEKQIARDFGDVDTFKKKFVEEGVGQFGSGWVWLVADKGKLEIVKTGNADNPLPLGKTALLTCDVWEHAYYIDYRNRREPFLKTFVDHLANWDRAAELLEKANGRKQAA